MTERPPAKPKTGHFDRYYSLGVSQGGLAGYKGDPYSYVGTSLAATGLILPRRDDILIEEGGGGPRAIEKYMRLFNDSQVISAWEKITGEIIQRKWEIDPASQSSKDEEVAEFVRQSIYRMGTNTRQAYGKEMLVNSNSGFDTFCRGMCESLILGMSVGEICWMKQGSYIVPSEIKIRDPRRFIFVLNSDGTVSPRLMTIDSPVEGIPLPLRSVIIHRHWAYSNFMDPYGTGLGRHLFSLVEFRRTLMSFWLMYADKYTTPTAVGTFQLGTPQEEVDALFTALQRIGQETAITVPDAIKVSLLDSSQQASPDVYNKLIDYVDQQISFIVNGENTVGQETGSTGSYARDQISDSVRIRKAKAFSEELDETINSTLIRWIVELNYPGAAVPRLRRNFEDIKQKEDPIRVVQMLSQLSALGYKVKDLDWVRDKLEVPSLVFKPPEENMGGAMPMSEPKSEEAMADEENGSIGAFGGDEVMSLFDFAETEESSTSKDLVSKIIAKKFAGTLDDVGYERVISDSGSSEASVSRVRIDEYTSPADLAFGSDRLLEEIKKTANVDPKDFSLMQTLVMTLGPLSRNAMAGITTASEVESLIKLYKQAYRLNRRVVHRECVVVDQEKAGYWKYFQPYFC